MTHQNLLALGPRDDSRGPGASELETDVNLYHAAIVDSRPQAIGSMMELGAFSISLAVQDMAASRDFYSKLGFEKIAGDGETWTIVANHGHVIGLFQGMFDSNILTFNPGWTGLGEPVEEFIDIRVLSKQLKEQGIELASDTTEETPSGPASFTTTDPDGNAILFDQHV